MSFDRPVSVDEKLDLVGERVHRFDGYCVDPSEKNIEEVADCPPTFEPVAELRRFTAGARVWVPETGSPSEPAGEQVVRCGGRRVWDARLR